MTFFDLIISIVLSTLASSLTYLISIKYKLGPIKASAGLSFVVAMVFYCWPQFNHFFFSFDIPLMVIGASFCGMSANAVLKNVWQAVLAGAFFGFIFFYATSTFQGFGGGLGTIACLSVLTTHTLISLTKPKQSLRLLLKKSQK